MRLVMPSGNEHGWFRRSKQIWKIRVMWVLGGFAIAIGSFGLWLQVGAHTFSIHIVLIAFCSGVGAYVIGALVRCCVCGERVVATLYQHRSRSWFATDLRMLDECPVCGDPGDGSNPKHW